MHSDDLGTSYDVIVIGGGAAGLSGALMLARCRRSVVVIDSEQPRNAPAEGVHGLLGRDGMPPIELLDRGRAEVRSYGGTVVAGTVSAVSRGVDGGFAVHLADGRSAVGRRLLITTGLVDDLPAVDGLSERWGRDVIHCPYCHGWEVRDQAVGILATGPMAGHQAQLFRQLSDDVVVFAHTSELGERDRARLLVRGIGVVDGEVTGLHLVDDRIAGVRLVDGTVVSREVVVVQTRMEARAGFLTDLGLAPIEHPMGVGTHVPADPTGQTAVRGVYVAGNITDLTAQVGAAAAAGALAGARINADLVEEVTDRLEQDQATARAISVTTTDASPVGVAAH